MSKTEEACPQQNATQDQEGRGKRTLSREDEQQSKRPRVEETKEDEEAKDSNVLLLVFAHLHPIDIFQRVTRVNKQFHHLCSEHSALWGMIVDEEYQIEYSRTPKNYQNCVAFAKEVYEVRTTWNALSKYYTFVDKEHEAKKLCAQQLQKKSDELAANLSAARDPTEESDKTKIEFRVPLELRLFLSFTEDYETEVGLKHQKAEDYEYGFYGTINSIDTMLKLKSVCEAGVFAVAVHSSANTNIGAAFEYIQCNVNKDGYGRLFPEEATAYEGRTIRAWIVAKAEEYFMGFYGYQSIIDELKALYKFCGVRYMDL